MWPVLTQVTLLGVERPIASYGVMLVCALLSGAGVFVGLARRDGLDVGRVIACAAIAVGAGMLGAHTLFAIVETFRTGELPWLTGRFGLVFLGGACGGALGLFVASRALALSAATLFDHAVMALALGHALGRIGCLLGGCCYGVEWHGLDGHGLLSLTYTDGLAPAAHPSVPRFPTPIVEALAVLMLAGSLWAIRARGGLSGGLSVRGRLALSYVLGYAALRFLIEGLRGDAVRGVMVDGMFSTSQMLSLLVVVSVFAVSRFKRSGWVALSLCLVFSTVHGDARAQLAMQAPAVIHVGAGWFTLGSDAADVNAAVELCQLDADRPDLCRPELFEDEGPARRVYLSAYRIDRTEVSNAAYRRCVAANICAPPRVSDADPRLSAPEHPVTGINFHAALHYCAWLGGSLPTEAQWEKAARGTTSRNFPWGNLWNSRLANHGRGMGAEDPIDGYDYAAPVDAFVDARSPFGLLNMAGNVAEMTLDYYDERGYAALERVDPRGPTEGSERVVRGGSWRSPAFTLRTAHRTHMAENDTQPDVGFRCSYAP